MTGTTTKRLSDAVSGATEERSELASERATAAPEASQRVSETP
jgi:hypothetical protein